MVPGANAPDEKSAEDRLIAVELDGSIHAPPSADAEHERKVAIYDLLSENFFRVKGETPGPYRLTLSIAEGRLVLDIRDGSEERCSTIGLALSSFRRIVKDYFLICESYYKAIRTATPSQIETIDLARRALHNDGSTLLKERLQGKVEIDFDTARRLFTLVCVLHWRG
jgi:uncharacterized protein (UPF0262 family)